MIPSLPLSQKSLEGLKSSCLTNLRIWNSTLPSLGRKHLKLEEVGRKRMSSCGLQSGTVYGMWYCHCPTNRNLQKAGKGGHPCLSPWHILWLSLHMGRYHLCFSGTTWALQKGLVGHCLNLILHEGVSTTFKAYQVNNNPAMGLPLVRPQKHLLHQ